MTWTYTDGDEQQDVLLARLGDACAAQRLLKAHQPLIESLVRRFMCDASFRQDLFQAGNLGLLRAMRHYEPSRDVRFITYAVPWILGEMRLALRRSVSEALSLDEPFMDGQTLHNTLQSAADMNLAHIDLRLALQSLDCDERLLICLRYFRDKTQAETATLLKKSQTQVSRMERRILDKLNLRLRDLP